MNDYERRHLLGKLDELKKEIEGLQGEIRDYFKPDYSVNMDFKRNITIGGQPISLEQVKELMGGLAWALFNAVRSPGQPSDPSAIAQTRAFLEKVSKCLPHAWVPWNQEGQ